MNTGIQRVVRSLHQALHRLMDVEPLIWDDQLASYCRLSAREQGFLSRSNADEFKPAGEPEFAANPWPWSKLQRHFTHRLNRVDLVTKLAPGDVLLVPEIFQDRRIEWLRALPQNAPQARRTAVFYDAITLRHPEFSSPSRRHRFDEYASALSKFDQIIAISEQSATDLKSHWRASGTVAQPPVSVRGLALEHARRNRPKAHVHDSRRVLCVSTFEQRKNHLTLLAAAELLWSAGVEFSLELIGRTTRDWGSNVIAEIDRLASHGRGVKWHKHVGEAELSSAYENSRFTVFPSIVEGFGLPIVESLWHGKPCVCGNDGAIAETAREGGCRMIDVTNVESLSAAMRELLSQNDVLERLSAEAAARRFMTWEQWVAQARNDIAGG